jgi:tRNA(Glu) U13 pseudouridine synthase TruD
VKTDELQKVSEELEAKLEKSDSATTDEQDKEESTVSALHKALDLVKSLLGAGEKKSDAVEEEKVEELVVEPTAKERLAKSEETGQEGVYKELVTGKAGDKVEEMVDATPVLESLVDIVAKSEGRAQAIHDMLADQDARITALMQANAALLKGFEALYTQNNAMPKRNTSPGFVMVPGAQEGKQAGEMPKDLQAKVLKAVQEGKVDAKVWSWFDTRTDEQIWAALPQGVLD